MASASTAAAAGTGSSDDVLARSLNDARQLLWYASREGRVLPPQIVDAIIEAETLLRGGNRDPDVEGRFWVAFRDLADVVRPVSVDSIAATYGIGDRRSVEAETTKRRYSVFAVVVLALLLMVQIYWFVGTTLRTDLETHRAELDGISGSLRQLTFRLSNVGDLIAAKQMQQQRAVGSLDPTSGLDKVAEVRDNAEQLAKDIDELKRQEGEANSEYFNIQRRSERISAILAGNGRLLDRWDFITEIVAVESDSSPSTGEGKAMAAQQIVLGTRARPTSDTAARAEAWEALVDSVSDRERALVSEQLKFEIALLSSKSVIAILGQYLLPLLYGLLGALAYILRTLSTEIQEVTFTRSSSIRYSLRWPLGMLAGVTVGLFFDPANLSALAAITPLGLAFLAGYGVELLFTGLDRLVQAFTGEGPKSTKPA